MDGPLWAAIDSFREKSLPAIFLTKEYYPDNSPASRCSFGLDLAHSCAPITMAVSAPF